MSIHKQAHSYTHTYIQMYTHTYKCTHIHIQHYTMHYTILYTPPTFPCEYYQISVAQREAVWRCAVPRGCRIHYTACDIRYGPVQQDEITQEMPQ